MIINFHSVPLTKIGRFVTEAKGEKLEHFRVRRSLRMDTIAQMRQAMRQNMKNIMENVLDQYPIGMYISMFLYFQLNLFFLFCRWYRIHYER